MELFCELWNLSHQSMEEVPKLVLLHGMGGTGRLWRPLAAALEENMALLAPDQRGHGKSQIPQTENSKQASYRPKDYGQDVIDTLEKLSFHSTWILGHSMGVRTAVAAAHLRPDWVKGLILVDLGFSGVAGGGLGENLARFLKILPLQFSSRAEAREFMTRECPDPSIALYLMAVSVSDGQGQLTFPFDHAALIQTIDEARNFSIKEWVRDLGSKEIPIYILRGTRSLVWTHEEFEKEKASFSDLKSIQFLEIPDAGHGLPFEQKARLVELLRGWIL